MKKNTRVFKKNNFAKIYLRVMAVFIVIISCFLAFYWFFLDSFEKTNPENAASQVFRQYFYELAFNKLFHYEKPFISKLETLDNYTAYLNEKAQGGERRYLHVKTDYDTDDIRNYIVFSGNEKFAEFVLKKRMRFNTQIWKLSYIISAYKKFDTFNIVVPEGSAVFVNSISLDRSYKTSAAVKTPLAGAHDIYTIAGLIKEPVVEVPFAVKNQHDVVFSHPRLDLADKMVKQVRLAAARAADKQHMLA